MIRLVSMNEDDCRRFIAWALQDYAQQQVRVGAWRPEEAVGLAQVAIDTVLPEGLSSPGQFLYVIEREADGEQLGYLWFGVREEGESRYMALYDCVIFEAYRRRGYASEALKAMEEKVREQGMQRIVLHVFGHNEGARALYRKMGYTERNVTMVRELGA